MSGLLIISSDGGMLSALGTVNDGAGHSGGGVPEVPGPLYP